MRATEFIVEAHHQDLYHSTLLRYAFRILQQGQIRPGDNWESSRGHVSLTRDWRLAYQNDYGDNEDPDDLYVTFVIDQDRLRHSRKVVPFNFGDKAGGPAYSAGDRVESEELVRGSVPIKVIKGVIIKNTDVDQPRMKLFMQRAKQRGLSVDIKRFTKTGLVDRSFKDPHPGSPHIRGQHNLRPTTAPKA
jgi:hypothetical protein